MGADEKGNTMERYRWTRDMLLDDALVVSIVEAGTGSEERLVAALAAHGIETSEPWAFAYGVLRGAVRDLREARRLDEPQEVTA